MHLPFHSGLLFDSSAVSMLEVVSFVFLIPKDRREVPELGPKHLWCFSWWSVLSEEDCFNT